MCEATLDQLFLNEDDPLKYTGQMPSEKSVLFQLTSGLDYIHSKGIVHCNIKPENVVIVGSDTDVHVKWAGFGHCKQILDRVSLELMQGSMNWMAPELLKCLFFPSDNEPGLLTVQSDLFSAGCVFFFFLAGGIHPFGDGQEIVPNILSGNQSNIQSKIIILFIVPD